MNEFILSVKPLKPQYIVCQKIASSPLYLLLNKISENHEEKT